MPKRVQNFRQQFLPDVESATSPFSKVGDNFLLTGNIQTHDYVKGKKGWKLSNELLQRQLGFMMKVIDQTGNGDFTTLQDAINAGHKNIFLRIGEYTLTENLNISSDTVIEGEHWEKTIIQGDFDFLLGASTNVVIRNINRKWGHAGSYVISGAGNNNRVEHCKLTYTGSASTGDGINLTGQFCSVKDCFILCGNLMMNIGNNRNWIQRNYFIGGSNARINISGNSVYFQNNFCTKAGTGNTYFIFTTGDRLFMTSNDLFNTADSTIGIYSSGDNCSILDNDVENFSNQIQVFGFNSTVSINRCKSAGGDGIFVNCSTVDGNWTTVTNNDVKNPVGDGIHLGNREQLTCSGNTVNGAGARGFESFAVNSHEMNFTGNSAKNCTSHGMHFPGTGGSVEVLNSTVVGNISENNGGDGILIVHDKTAVGLNNSTNNTGANFNNTAGANSQVGLNQIV